MARLPSPPIGLEARVNTILSDLVSALATTQADYKKQIVGEGEVARPRGRYFQGIRTHVLLPSDGNKSAPNMSLKPTDQAENWTDLGVGLPATMEVAVAVDVYESPKGWGYVVRGELEVAGKIWLKTIGVGPEVRDQDWTQLSSS